MKTETIYNTYNKLKKDKLSFLYRGPYNKQIAEKVKDFSEFNTSCLSQDSEFISKIGSLVIESFKTVLQPHSEYYSPYYFSIRSYDACYFLACSQFTSDNDAFIAKECLQQIEKMDPDTLKFHFLDIIKKIKQQKLEGLELLDLAQKSGEKPDYSFKVVNENNVLFSLQLKTRSILDSSIQFDMGTLAAMGFDIEQSPPEIDEPISFVEDMNEFMGNKHIQMIYHGDFSQKTILHLIKMIEENLLHLKKDIGKAKKVLMVLIELLQNISKHGEKYLGNKEGIFMLAKQGDDFVVSVGNWLATASINNITSHIEKINSFDEAGLNNFYSQTLMQGPGSEQGGAGVGLIDVALMSKEKIKFDTFRKDEMYSFGGISVKI
jgi:hypothetical protein